MEATNFSCYDCGRQFTNNFTLWRHRKKIHMTDTYTCKKCSSEFKRYDVMRKHLTECESVPDSHASACSNTCSPSESMQVFKNGAVKLSPLSEKSVDHEVCQVGYGTPFPKKRENVSAELSSASEEELSSEDSSPSEEESVIHKQEMKKRKRSEESDSEDEESGTDEQASSLIYKQMKKRKRSERSDSEVEESGTDEGESSGIENCDENDWDNDYESAAETSESDGEEVEETMFEGDKLKTYINWPISRTYRITNPWAYWGEVPKIKKHIRWLERLNDVEGVTVMYNVRNASTSQLAALTEIAYNCVKGHVPLEKSNWREMCNHRRSIRLLASPDVDVEEKRDEILRRGADFVRMLLNAINPLVLLNIPRALKVDTSQEDNEDDEY